MADIAKLVNQLREQRRLLEGQIRRLDGAISALAAGGPPASGAARRARKTAKAAPRARKKMSAAQRKAVSQRMKKYWAGQRKAKASKG